MVQRVAHRHVFALVASAILALDAEAAKPKPTPCSGGRFVVQNAPLVIGHNQTSVAVVVIGDDALQLGGECSSPTKLKAGKRGTTFKALVPGCPGTKGKVKITGAFDGSCDTVSATVKVKKAPKSSFTAKRSRCGDGFVDGPGGEQCEPAVGGCSSGIACTATCTCESPTTTLAPPTTTVPSSITTTTTLGTATTTTTLPNAKSVALSAITGKFASFDGSDLEAENRELLAFVRSRPEFTESGLSGDGDSVWARFPDGTTLAIGDNLIPTGAPIFTRGVRRPRLSMRNSGIPETLNVVLANSLGTGFGLVTEEIADMFNMEIYSRVQPDSTVDALKSFHDVAVLYLSAHGTAVPIRNGGAPVYLVWTSTVRTTDGSTDAQYQADLQDGSLTYFMSHTFNLTDQGDITQAVETHYAITENFVRKYWSGRFAKNSMVFIDACRSTGPDAQIFAVTCILAGASLYVGWTDRVQGGDAAVSAGFLFDRMLGTNTENLGVPKESPPQRPFTFTSVLDEMQQRQRPNQSYPLDTSTNSQTGVTAKLTAEPGFGDFELLAPSISDLAVNEGTDELSVNGDFGTKEGVVQLGGNNLMIKSWESYGIICALPRDGSGAVKVTVNDGAQFSNEVPLTAWHATATYTVEGVGSLTLRMTFNLTFRGDVHETRYAPGEKPVSLGLGATNSLLSHGTYELSGSWTDPTGRNTIMWSGAGALKAEPTSSDGTLSASLGIVNEKWDMQVNAFATGGQHNRQIGRDMQGKVISDQTIDRNVFGVRAIDLTGDAFQGTAPHNFDITAGSRSAIVDSEFGGGDKAKITVEWSFSIESSPTSMTTASRESPPRRQAVARRHGPGCRTSQG